MPASWLQWDFYVNEMSMFTSIPGSYNDATAFGKNNSQTMLHP